MTGIIQELNAFTLTDEIFSRHILDLEKFLELYKAADKERMREMILISTSH